MRRIVVGLLSTLSGLVLLFSYHTSTNSGTGVTVGGTSGGSAGGSAGGSVGSGSAAGSGSGSASGAGSSSGGTSGANASGAKTYTGDAVMTRWGVVQVEITVEGGRITSSDAVRFPTGNGRDREINSYAVPALNDEVVQAQSAQIDAISGATVTSEGYIQSLQSAVDQVNR